MKAEQLYDDLKVIVSKKNIEKDKPLKEYTYTKLGGEADFFVTPETYEQVRRVVKYAYENRIPFTLLGNGSNLIIKDGGIRGIVMNLEKLDKITNDGATITAEAGARIIDVSRFALKDRKSTRLNSSHVAISYAVFCLKK